MKFNYTTPCVTKKLAAIRSFINQQLNQAALSEQEKHQVVLAIDEACANAMIHGNSCDKNRELKVELEILADKIIIEIYDVGDYHPNEVEWSSRNLMENIRSRRKGGMGLRLIHCIMDKVRYYHKGDVNVCALTYVPKT